MLRKAEALRIELLMRLFREWRSGCFCGKIFLMRLSSRHDTLLTTILQLMTSEKQHKWEGSFKDPTWAGGMCGLLKLDCMSDTEGV